MPDLEYVSLGSVEINEFPPQEFKNLPSLLSLSLHNTDLNIFSIEEFPTLQNISLSEVGSGNISNIDLNSATNIQSVYIAGFDSLNNFSLKNGNNSIISSFRTQYNPNLYCISVDDTSHFYSLNSNQLYLDPQQYFKINCP